MSKIHPTAVIGSDVRLGENVIIHPYAVLDGKIEIGDACEIGPHSYITGYVKIGKNTKLVASAYIGTPPQDYSYDGIPGLCEVGENCIIREGVTIHTPVKGKDGEKTVIGNNVMMMANSHAGHNAKVGDNTILVNGCLLGGHVIVGHDTIISGNVAVHQNCRIGNYVMVGGVTKITQDVPHFFMVDRIPSLSYGLNVVGLKRKGFSQEDRTTIKKAYKLIYSGKPMKEIIAELKSQFAGNSHVLSLAEFLEGCKRGIVGSSGLEE